MQSVLKPGFEAAYPQYKLNYVSKGTGAAIAYAEAGTASALLVHAASLENQFVAGGYSTEQYGRAVFYGDYVLLGPPADPAGVLSSSPHDIVGAFQRIATAGEAGQANFVSRGGTPGTTVQEHAIWALTSGVTTCAVSKANGGGTSPSTATGDCPSSIQYPSWYHATGLTQGPNIVNADTCNYSGGNCYVLTDRGTYEYLRSTGAVSTLRIAARDNDASAPGGANLLVNSFHAYAVNPKAFSPDVAAQINAPAANAFLGWVTSVAAQTAVGQYLNSDGQPPFLPDASPTLSVATLPSDVRAGSPLTLSGTLVNKAPGTPALAGQHLTLTGLARGASTPQTIATVTTDSAGAFRYAFTPTRTQTYALAGGPFAQVENASLSPVFGDLLGAVAAPLGQVTVNVAPTFTLTPRIVTAGQSVVVTATGTPGKVLELLVRRAPSTAYTVLTAATLPDSGRYSFPRVAVRTNTAFAVRQRDTRVTSHVQGVTVRSLVTLKAARVRTRTYALSGTVSPYAAKQTVTVYQLNAGGSRTGLGTVAVGSRGVWRLQYVFGSRYRRTLQAVSSAIATNASGTSARYVLDSY